MIKRLTFSLGSVLLLCACGGGGGGDPTEADAREACWGHIREEAEVRQIEIDVFNTASVEQKGGWAFQGTISPDKGPKLQYYCQVNTKLRVTDSEVTTAG